MEEREVTCDICALENQFTVLSTYWEFGQREVINFRVPEVKEVHDGSIWWNQMVKQREFRGGRVKSLYADLAAFLV